MPSKGTPRPPSLIGKSVGPYKIVEWIGSGTCASVYTAVEKGNVRNKVAVKCVEKEKLSKAAVENIIVEIRLLKKLRHPHILEMKDFLWDDQYIYIVTEYCGGGDLAAILRSKRGLREPLARRYLQQMAFALKYLRENDVSHMDLKPHNLLLSSASKTMIKIGDFGLAQHLPEEERKTSLRGSPLYMAPEILFGKPYDAKVDLWSAGVILYEMAYGSAPYSSSTIDGMLEKVRLNQPIQFPEVSARGERLSHECLDLLPRLLERDPKRRIDFSEFFVHPFVDLADAVGPDSLEKAKYIAEEAVVFDKAGKVDEAVNRYASCVQHLRAALMYTNDEKLLPTVRERIRSYEKRCENLSKLRSQSSAPSKATMSACCDTDEKLIDLARSTPRMEAGILIGMDAESYERGCQFEAAQEAYENALSTLVPGLRIEPKGERRDLLSKKVHDWLSRAEKLKLLLAGEKDLTESVDEDKAPALDSSSHLTWGELIAKEMDDVTVKIEDREVPDIDRSLDVTSPDFNPWSALRNSQPFPVSDVRVFDNVRAYELYVRRGGNKFTLAEEKEETEKYRARQAERSRKAEVVKSKKASRDAEVQVQTTGRRCLDFRNIISSMEKIRRAGGPISRLVYFMESGARVKVRTRNFGEIRGECTGFLEMFDKFWNLIMRDVDEVYQRLVTTTDHTYDLEKAIAVVDPRYAPVIEKSTDNIKKESNRSDGGEPSIKKESNRSDGGEPSIKNESNRSDGREPSIKKESNRSDGRETSEPRSTGQEPKESDRRREPNRDRKDDRIGRREERKPRRCEPSEGVYAKIVEELGDLSLQDSGAKAPKIPDRIPPAILVFKKVDGSIGKRAIFRRHVPMMMIRGENIVTVSSAGSE